MQRLYVSYSFYSYFIAFYTQPESYSLINFLCFPQMSSHLYFIASYFISVLVTACYYIHQQCVASLKFSSVHLQPPCSLSYLVSRSSSH